MFGACQALRPPAGCGTPPRVTNVQQLPDDPALLKGLLIERETQIEQIKREAAERIEAMEQRHKAEMDAVLRRFYGPRSEKFDPTELLLFGVNVAEQVPVDESVVEAEAGEKLVTRRINHHKHGRRKLPGHLPRVEVVHDLTDEQKICPCCGEARVCIGSETSEQLEYVPASLKVLKHVRHKYACKACDANGYGGNIEIAAKTAQPIEKGLPGPGLLAYVIVSKLGDHLPLYRLERIFDRHGVDIARSTMCAWMFAGSELVKPLVELMSTRVKQSKVIHTDETRVPVQDGTVKGPCKSGRIWTYIGDESKPYVVYDYTPDRTRAGPQRFLADYQGYLQADAYGGYDGIYIKGGVTEVACWAHARRKFFDAKETDGRRSAEMLEVIRQLYAIEDEAKAQVATLLGGAPDASLDQRHQLIRVLRQEKSLPVLAKIKAWLDAESRLVLPRSPMAAAITYTLNQWDALCRYTEQGFLNIDNNAAERALKRIAIGRKNWLFAGHDAAGASHARLWTLIASAERHGIDPQKYLTSILAKIGQTKLSEVEQFLPEKWKAEDQHEPPLAEGSSRN
jgi:transposase